jgi:hypothetical protein
VEQKKQDLLNTMGYLAKEAKIEVDIAENAGISRTEYNRIIENGGELPDCIKKYREDNQVKQTYEEALIESALKEQLGQVTRAC